ncbi:hypothetical protein SSP24_42110 [Streptomyces spinoverrucosus]|uniref:DUF397 domain-containing protein n=1 Tax=Streptomyces spinoverrucosus TaxID=284043 RepID=A0A4Y3VNE4_9ACTN|nr:DUF397 domain-containing protein [Streptomyces spinoverrucosus]GEC06556.1 hypothetical protein SSP24_42110 [Streptomyces spinoverrucosus]GHB54363.1 hypothetical protein GCM10010397_25740 [Streptomyces spinoverrucosus]
MSAHRWKKSSYCQEGDACVHISVTPQSIHLTDRPTSPQTVLTVSRAAFASLLGALKDRAPLTPVTGR